MLVQAEMTDMLDFMQDIGVPDYTSNNVLFFGWNPIVPPVPAQDQIDLSELNFGLAMYEYGNQLYFTFVNGKTENEVDSTITGIYFDDRIAAKVT